MNTPRTFMATVGLAILGLTACATTRPAATSESVVVADPRHGIPPATRNSDPEVTEQRFGFSEARARREAKARADAEQGSRVDVESVKEPRKNAAQPATGKAPPHTQPGAAKPSAAPAGEPACPSCKAPATGH